MHRHLVACALRRATIFIAIELSLSLIAGAQDVQMLDPVLDQIVGHDAKIECVANGFDKWTEGPVWTREGTLFVCGNPSKQHRRVVSRQGRESLHAS